MSFQCTKTVCKMVTTLIASGMSTSYVLWAHQQCLQFLFQSKQHSRWRSVASSKESWGSALPSWAPSTKHQCVDLTTGIRDAKGEIDVSSCFGEAVLVQFTSEFSSYTTCCHHQNTLFNNRWIPKAFLKDLKKKKSAMYSLYWKQQNSSRSNIVLNLFLQFHCEAMGKWSHKQDFSKIVLSQLHSLAPVTDTVKLAYCIPWNAVHCTAINPTWIYPAGLVSLAPVIDRLQCWMST